MPEANSHMYLFKDTLDILNGKLEAEKRRPEVQDPRRKRIKRENEDFESVDTPPNEGPNFEPPQSLPPANTVSFDVLQLPFPVVVEIVLQSLPNMPYEMPPNFAQACEVTFPFVFFLGHLFPLKSNPLWSMSS